MTFGWPRGPKGGPKGTQGEHKGNQRKPNRTQGDPKGTREAKCIKSVILSAKKRGTRGDPRETQGHPRGTQGDPRGGKSGLASRRNCIPRKSVFLQKSNRAWRLDETYNNNYVTLSGLAHSAAKRPNKKKNITFTK